MVGRTPRSAADAPVGLFAPCKMPTPLCRQRDGASRADQGVRPTNAAAFPFLGLSKWHWASVRQRPLAGAFFHGFLGSGCFSAAGQFRDRNEAAGIPYQALRYRNASDHKQMRTVSRTGCIFDRACPPWYTARTGACPTVPPPRTSLISTSISNS